MKKKIVIRIEADRKARNNKITSVQFWLVVSYTEPQSKLVISIIILNYFK